LKTERRGPVQGKPSPSSTTSVAEFAHRLRFHVRRTFNSTQTNPFTSPNMVSHYAPLTTRFVGSVAAPRSTVVAVEADDANLIAAARGGNATAYGSLVGKYQNRLCVSLCHAC